MRRNKKLLVPICCVLIVLLVGALVTIAFMKNDSNTVTNNFIGSTVGCVIQEDVTSTPGVKKDVKIKNDGLSDAFVRAFVIVNWVDDSGNIYPIAPVAGVDYTVVTPETYGFITNGTEYYCKTVVKAGETSPVLFTSVAPVEGKAPEGYTLSVEILGSSIQYKPTEEVENVWGVTVENDIIVGKED